MQQVADDIAAAYAGEAMAVWGDLAQDKEVKRIADDIRATWKQIDILVCCAGGNVGAQGVTFGAGGRPSNDDCLNISLDDLQSVMDRNLMTAVLCCRPSSYVRHGFLDGALLAETDSAFMEIGPDHVQLGMSEERLKRFWSAGVAEPPRKRVVEPHSSSSAAANAWFREVRLCWYSLTMSQPPLPCAIA